MAAPKINGVDQPYPSAVQGPQIDEAYRGSGRELADGSVTFDFVNATKKRVWRLQWKSLTGANLAIIQTAYDTVATSASTSYAPSTGGSYNVTLSPDEPELKVTIVKKSGTTPLYDVQWTLREV